METVESRSASASMVELESAGQIPLEPTIVGHSGTLGVEVELAPGDLCYAGARFGWGQMHARWATSPAARRMSAASWRVFALIVAAGSPSRATPWRVVYWTDADLSRALPGTTRPTVARARALLVELGYVRTQAVRGGGYLWVLRDPVELCS